MRIFVVSNGYPSKRSPQWGCFERDQAEALAALNHEVVMISYDRRFRWFWRKLGITTIQRNNVTSINIFLVPNQIVRLFGKRFYQWFKHWQIDYVYKRAVKLFGNPDVLYSHFLPVTSNAIFLKQKYGIPLVAMEHWSEIVKENIRPGFLRMGQDTYPHVDKLLSVSPVLQNHLIDKFNVQSEVVYNIVGREFDYDPSVQPNETFTIVSVGSLIHLKRLDIAIEAFNIVHKHVPSQLLIIGEGPELHNIKTQILKLGLGDSVKLLGRKTKTEIADLYRGSHVLLLSSELETFSVVCIEAMACGLPVVATRCGGPESFVNQENGILCSINDVSGMAEALLSIINNYNQYNHKEIADSCQRRFGADTIAHQLTQIFEETIKHFNK